MMMKVLSEDAGADAHLAQGARAVQEELRVRAPRDLSDIFE